MPSQAHVEHILHGPVSVARGDGEAVRIIDVVIGVNLFRIPLRAQGCTELSKALALSDEELAQVTEQQQRVNNLLLPNGATRP